MEENSVVPQRRRDAEKERKSKRLNLKTAFQTQDFAFLFFPFNFSFSASLRLCGLILLLVISAASQPPTVEKVDPPNWWASSTINPVRILVKGTNLTGARVESSAQGITVSNISISANGHYLFADVRIAENMKPGDYPIKITTSSGTVNAPFSIFTPAQRMGNNQG